MIELPALPAPNGMQITLLDFGLVQRGAASLRVNRPGSRFRVSFTFPPMLPDTARLFVARLVRGKRDGIKVELPLLVEQPSAGAPVVDGAGQSGQALALRGLTPSIVIGEGHWLTITTATGSSFLHSVAVAAQADGLGRVSLQIEPPLRAAFADGDAVELEVPFVTGFVDGEAWEFALPLDRLASVQFTMEEFA